MTDVLDVVAAIGPGIVARATVVFAVAAGVAVILRTASAAQRHVVWAAALAAALVLPALHLAAPAWPVLPTVDMQIAAAGKAADGPRASPASVVVPPAAVSATEPDGPQGAGRRSAADRVVLVGRGLAAIWLLGVFVFATRLVLALLRLRQHARQAGPATGRVAARLAEHAASSGVRGTVRGLVTREPVVPMAWGWLRPAVLLPVEAGTWSEERLRVVLLHEIAHIRRGDVATQFVGELARGLFWFHPLAWWSLWRLRAEQEAACDDCVLRAGTHPDDYADDLLAVTATLSAVPWAGGGLAMGRPERIEARVRAILAAESDRRPVGRVRLAAVGGLFAAVATLAAIVAPASGRDEAARPPVEPAARVDGGTRFPDAATAELVGRWIDTADANPGEPLEIVADEKGLWIDRAGTTVRLETVAENTDVDAARTTTASAVIADGEAERRLRITRVPHALVVEISTRFTDGSGRPNQRSKSVYARPEDFLPNGYYVFFANSAEAGIGKEGVNFGALIAGPHVPEIGNSGSVIFGRIDPKPGLPPHPDHAPGFFLIDSATDTATTGLERDEWLATLEALGVRQPRLVPAPQKWPKRL